MKPGRHATHTAVVNPRNESVPLRAHHGQQHAEGSILLSVFLRANQGTEWQGMQSTHHSFSASVALRESPIGRYLHVSDVRHQGRSHHGRVHVVIGREHYTMEANGLGDHTLAMHTLQQHDPRKEVWLLKLDAK